MKLINGDDAICKDCGESHGVDECDWLNPNSGIEGIDYLCAECGSDNLEDVDGTKWFPVLYESA